MLLKFSRQLANIFLYRIALVLFCKLSKQVPMIQHMLLQFFKQFSIKSSPHDLSLFKNVFKFQLQNPQTFGQLLTLSLGLQILDFSVFFLAEQRNQFWNRRNRREKRDISSHLNQTEFVFIRGKNVDDDSETWICQYKIWKFQNV
jgi:hypothetical protein